MNGARGIHGIAFLCLLIFISFTPSLTLILSQGETTRFFVKPLNVIVVDGKGNPVGSAKVFLYELNENDSTLLAETYTNSIGVAMTTLSLPLTRYGKSVYVSVNLKVVVVKDGYFGVYFFAVDPSYELLGPKNIVVTVHRYEGKNNVGLLWEHSYNEIYRMTPVLRFATYYGVSAKWDYPIGSKIKVQAKCRWPPNSSYPWYDCGYTEVTLDAGLGLVNPVSGPWLRTLYFDLKYRYSIISLGAVAYEEVYAVDTSSDPRSNDCTRRYWNGHAVTGSAYYDVRPGEYLTVNVTGGYKWDFSVAISFSYPWSVTVTLGVDKVQAPLAKLKYIVTGSQGEYVRIVSVGDRDFLDTRVYWHD